MVTYNGPIGEPIENPNTEFIKDIFFNKSDEYWKQGSGDSCFEVDGCDEWLIFFYDEPHGFFIIKHPDYLVPFNKNVKTEKIQHLVGGEPMHIPTCSYVNRETAYKIVDYFITTKKIPRFIEWIDLYDIEFDYDF